MTYEETSVPQYFIHFLLGSAVAPPDMGVAYTMRIMPVLIVAYGLHHYTEFDSLIGQASFT